VKCFKCATIFFAELDKNILIRKPVKIDSQMCYPILLKDVLRFLKINCLIKPCVFDRKNIILKTMGWFLDKTESTFESRFFTGFRMSILMFMQTNLVGFFKMSKFCRFRHFSSTLVFKHFIALISLIFFVAKFCLTPSL
jgi:hypothetical protein